MLLAITEAMGLNRKTILDLVADSLADEDRELTICYCLSDERL